jgi:hypothetical protein
MAASQYAMLGRHPWLVQAFGSYRIYGPGKARHDDHSLAIYEAAGFPGAEADQATSAVFTFVIGNALGPAAAASFSRKLAHDGGDAEALMKASRAEIAEVAAQFPRLRARLGLPYAEYAAVPGDSFEFGLRAILDGLEGRLASPALRCAGASVLSPAAPAPFPRRVDRPRRRCGSAAPGSRWFWPAGPLPRRAAAR